MTISIGNLNWSKIRASLMDAFDLNKEEIKKAKSGGEHWITVRGRHILLDGEGNVQAGGKGMAGGKDLDKIGGKDNSSDSSFAANDEETSKKIASHAGISYEEFKTMHPGTQTELHFNWLKDQKKSGPSDKDLAATEFENTYSKKEAKVYAEGGVPKAKKLGNKKNRRIKGYNFKTKTFSKPPKPIFENKKEITGRFKGRSRDNK